MALNLAARQLNGGVVTGSIDKGYHLGLPVLPAKKYGLAQVDDYTHFARRKFSHQPLLRIQLEARVSGNALPGTWGFGLWNDPFSFSIGGGGMVRALPVMPNAAWFFYGSQENCLSLRDDQPSSGFHAKTFCSPRLPAILSLLAVPGLPFLFWPAAVRLLRRMARRLIKEAAVPIEVRVDSWHVYELIWQADQVIFSINQKTLLDTNVSPQGRLGLVIWIDNQYFRLDPDGKVGFGFLDVPVEQWLEIRGLSVTSP
jgi:hypothetical protein